ncbi:MAG TPA: DUF882 domain-containing protein [Alphaproteobacteria bacterium]|nr:DUF882 domain-containing protein [Alphaproteobacteria bacterium]
MTDPISEDRTIDLSRRKVLLTGIAAAGFVTMPSVMKPAFAATGMGAYRVAFRNAHTMESFSGVYRVGDRYLPEAFESINTILRDYRCGSTHPMDPRLMDLVYWLHYQTGQARPFDVISGYRSPQTNALLREAGGSGVARRSLHMEGKAVDIRLPGFSTGQLGRMARGMKAGGVGIYGKSDFVHIDTGKVRTW